MKTSIDIKFDDRHAANRLEAQVRDLRDRLRYETGRDRDDTLDDIAKIEHRLSRMHC